MMDSLVTVESRKRLSESTVWKVQRGYFDAVGVEAWANNVPHYITCNPYIAQSYAKSFIQFVQDHLRLKPNAKKQPFYLIELGAGTGKFGFYAIKFIMEWVEKYNLDIQIKYIITDFTESNLNFWNEHRQMKEYIERGVLDFALYNLDSPDDLKLRHSGETLSKKSISNPLTVIANYIFDAVTQDVFITEAGELYEGLVSIKVSPDNYKGYEVQDWSQITIDYEKGEPAEHFYTDSELSILNTILKNHSESLSYSQFLIPIGGLKAMVHMKSLSKNEQVLILCSDKAYNRLEDLENLHQASRADYGKGHFAMVNLYAVEQFFKLQKGSALMQGPRTGLKSGFFSFGIDFEQYLNFKHTADYYLNHLSPLDYFHYHRFMSEQFNQATLEQIVTHLHFCEYDPYMFSRLMPRIRELMEQENTNRLTKLSLKNTLPRLASHYYFMPKVADSLFDIGVIYYLFEDYAKAIEHYQASASYFGQSGGLLFNIGLCQYYLGEKKQAINTFAQTLKVDPNFSDAKEWIEFLRNDMIGDAKS